MGGVTELGPGAAIGFALLAALAYLAVMVVGVAAVAGLQHLFQGTRRRGAGPTDDGGRLRARMTRLARPTLLLTPAKIPGFSKLGGLPELPSGADWPRNGGRPLAFVAQLDLAEVRDAGGPEWLPATGVLHVFNDDQRYGFPDHVRIVFSNAVERAPLAYPAELGRHLRYAERRLGFLRLRSVPSLEWLGVDLAAIQVGEEALDRLSEAPDAAFGDDIQHRIGGYPSELQSVRMAIACEYLARGLSDPGWREEIPPAIERAAKQWRLLLQVDHDPALGMDWGGGGRLYVFVREADARAGEFSRAIALSQID